MTTPPWRRVREIVAAAAELPPEARREYVERECAGDADLLREVLAWLPTGTVEESFLEPPSLDDVPAGPPPDIDGFEILEEIGRGGMGVVYRARDLRLDREVALKVFVQHGGRSRRDLERFQREARAIARLHHEAIVEVYSVGSDRDVHFLAMELVRGHDLARELRLAAAGSDAVLLPRPGDGDHPRRVAATIAAIASALQHAHDAGLVHRDIKPSNILLDEDARPRLVDFGLARDESLGRVSRTGELLGTPHYMSPEQVESTRHPVDHRTDVYSLGVVLFEMLTGERPFQGSSSLEVMSLIVRREPRSVRRLNPEVPVDLETICARAMEKDPTARYASARDLADDLERFLHLVAIHARPRSAGERLRRWVRRRRRECAVALAVTAAIAGLLFAWFSLEERRAARRIGTELTRTLADFEELPFGEPRARLERIRAALGERPSLRRRLATPAEELESRIDRRARDREAEAEARLREAMAEPGRRRPEDPPPPPPAADLRRAVAALAEAALERGSFDVEQLDLLDRLTSSYLDVRVRGARPDLPVELHLRMLDPVTDSLGAARPIAGFAPGRRLRLAPGLVRAVVVQAGFAFAEATVHLDRPAAVRSVEVTLVETSRRTRDMAAVEGGTVSTSHAVQDPSGGSAVVWIEHSVDPFWIDRRPVTNGEYAEFLRATGRPEPAGWIPERPDGFDDLPVTMLNVDEARTFAEWNGKRLPTRAEWLLAAGGPDGHRFPWGDEPDEELIALFRLDRPSFPSLHDYVARGREGSFAWYVENVRPSPPNVGREGGPHGLADLLGNVWEWTETRPFDRVRGVLRVDHDQRFMMGGGCSTTTRRVREYGLHDPTHGRSYRPRREIGFRCAKSRDPLGR